MENQERTILAFKIGRGGRFNNQGYLKYIGQKNISEFTENLFLSYENEFYLDECGNDVGLTKEEAENGIGRIDFDGDYNTIYTRYADELNENEFKVLIRDGENEFNYDEIIEQTPFYLKLENISNTGYWITQSGNEVDFNGNFDGFNDYDCEINMDDIREQLQTTFDNHCPINLNEILERIEIYVSPLIH